MKNKRFKLEVFPNMPGKKTEMYSVCIGIPVAGIVVNEDNFYETKDINDLLESFQFIKTSYQTLKTLEIIKELDCEKHEDLLRLLKDIEEFKNINIINEWWTGNFKSSKSRTSFYNRLVREVNQLHLLSKINFITAQIYVYM